MNESQKLPQNAAAQTKVETEPAPMAPRHPMKRFGSKLYPIFQSEFSPSNPPPFRRHIWKEPTDSKIGGSSNNYRYAAGLCLFCFALLAFYCGYIFGEFESPNAKERGLLQTLETTTQDEQTFEALGVYLEKLRKTQTTKLVTQTNNTTL